MKHRATAFRAFRYYRLMIVRQVRRKGVLSLLNKVFRKIARVTYRTTCSRWLVRRLDEPCASIMPGLPLEIEHLTDNKSRLIQWLRAHHAEFPWMYYPREIETACANGHLFTVITHENRIIGYLKIGINDVYIHDFDRIVRFPPGVAFVYDTFVLPSYRHKQTAYYALMNTMQYLRDRNYTRLWCHIEAWNKTSLKLFQKAGFAEKGTIRFSRLFSFPMFIKDERRPFYGWDDFLCAHD